MVYEPILDESGQVRFGSLADLFTNISSMSASGGKADVQTRQTIACKRLVQPARRPRKSEADFLIAFFQK